VEVEYYSCPICGVLLKEPAPPCPQCELIKSAKAKGIDIGPWEQIDHADATVQTYIEPSRGQTHIEPPQEAGIIKSLEDLHSAAIAAYESIYLKSENQRDAISLKVDMAALDLEEKKRLAKETGDYPKLIRLKYEHNYLDMRLIEWENGGPDPFMDLSEEGDSLEKFIESLSPLFEFIDFWWEKEPFLLYILQNRVDQRIERLISDSIDIPKNERTSAPYYNFINKYCKQPKLLFKGDIANGMLANVQWWQIYLSEAVQLIKENGDFKKIDKNGYFLTINKAQSRDFTIFKLIEWDRTWLVCPWIQEIITKYAYDYNFYQRLGDTCKGKPKCLTKIDKKELSQVKKDSQFIYDRFFCGDERKHWMKMLFEFIEESKSFPDSYESAYRDYENWRKFLARNLRE
jgi:hypothetical protein